MPATDALIPPAPTQARQVTRHIRTARMQQYGYVMATFTRTTVYTDPVQAPKFARVRPTNLGGAGKWSGHWDAEVVLQEFAKTETAALALLLESLDELRAAGGGDAVLYDREQARDILVALACTTDDTEWERRPLDSRGHRHRAKRHLWRDENGKQVRIQASTLRRHADPQCPCEHCTTARAAGTTTTTNETNNK